MNHRVNDWYIRTMRGRITNGGVLQVKFLPWFSIVGFTLVALFCLAFGLVLSYFMTSEILSHDRVLTNQLITSVERVMSIQAQLGGRASLGQLLDERTDLAALGVDSGLAAEVRRQYYGHLRMMPDVRLVNVFARDRTIIWSTNTALIGKVSEDNDELEEAIVKRSIVSDDSLSGKLDKEEAPYLSQSGAPFVKSYIPLMDTKGDVVTVVGMYGESHSLQQTINRGKALIWGCLAFGAIFLYIIPFWIFRRVDGALSEQQRRLREAEALCVVGEMSAAVAHGIRNPLATIRSSAELALDADPDAARKNAEDIITQVDRLSKWVLDLLVFSRPVTGENESINVVRLVEECLLNFTTQLQKNHISREFVRPTEAVPQVIANRVLANQALASIISNAIEAMPTGGSLQIQLQVSTISNRVDIIVNDTGRGMSPAQIELAFKPFYSTKRNGIGLGMPQVRRIMERFGGNVSLHRRDGGGIQACLSFRTERRPPRVSVLHKSIFQ